MRIFVAFIFFILTALPSCAITHRALIFGLGKYQDRSWTTIHGDNDMYYVSQFLMNSGFTDIKMLKNEQATKQAMVNAFIALANRCKKGDVVYIHYSGHGQLMTDLDGDEALRTTKRYGQWDESWVPYDAYQSYGQKDDGSKHFCDDEVEFYLSAIRNKIGRTGKMTVVIDACHSGESTRGEDEECQRGTDSRFVIPMTEGGAVATQSKPEQWLTVSACLPYQKAAELRNLNVGKLTYAIYSMGKEFFTISKSDLQQRLNSYMEINKGRLPQTPMITGNR